MEKIVHKVVLGSGKEVLLHEPKIKTKNLAIQAASMKAKDNQIAFAAHFQDEMLKLLLFQIDSKPVSGNAREDLDDLFTMQEYRQLQSCITRLVGDDSAGEASMELVPTGEK